MDGHEHIGAFALGPAPRAGGFRDDAWWIWCASAARDATGTYQLFASRWSKRTAFAPNWLTNSCVVRATATDVLGPYAFAGEVLPPRGADHWDGLMTHNPSIHLHGDTWLLFYTGTTFHGEVPTSGKLDHADPRRIEARANQRIGLATALSPAGPWTRRDAPILEPRPGCWDALLTTNPAPCVHADGSVLLLYKSTEQEGARLRYGVAWAPHWSGPYRRLRETPIMDDGRAGCTYEDACLWREGGIYHLLFNDLRGSFTGEDHAGGHATSSDGVEWTFAGKAYSRRVPWTDGSTVVQGSFERPQVLCDAVGRAQYLFAATADGPGGYAHAANTWATVREFSLRG